MLILRQGNSLQMPIELGLELTLNWLSFYRGREHLPKIAHCLSWNMLRHRRSCRGKMRATLEGLAGEPSKQVGRRTGNFLFMRVYCGDLLLNSGFTIAVAHIPHWDQN